jgi:signal transduction histidine kinase/CheY-like chemotaxis protein/HAMP domain-containing protein
VVEAKGEIAALSDTINEMTDTLATFAEQVTTVAREVGVEGQLGGQAKVPGAAGTWKGLTENVNQLAANLTTQVRAIAEVATAVTKGDLTRSIALEAQGEMASLKDTINEMIRNLRDTTGKNNEQDWLKTNLAKFTRMLQGQRDLMAVTKLILSELAPVVSAQHGVFYVMDDSAHEPVLKLTSTYAYRERKGLRNEFRVGEGLVGQCAFEKERILIGEVPGDYVRINSGLGESTPLNIIVLPVIFEGQVKAVIELASFHNFKDIHLSLLDQLTETIAIVLNTIAANMRTETLLTKSQSLAEELTTQQDELRETNTRLEKQAATLQESEDLLKRQQDELKQANEELETKASQLSTQKSQVEGKNREIELAKQELEERAEQLALTSKYKSEFLANMSHELRTPLNSLLILAEMLSDNSDGNLTPKQREFAQTIHASGSDLLSLINDILDMAKIESGTMAIDVGPVPYSDLREYVERTFRPVAQIKGIELEIELDPGLGRSVSTDAKRLQQVLRNLLSNAFKFTEAGKVGLRIAPASEGWGSSHPVPDRAGRVLAFSVIDTGIGIARDKQKVIFEPFQQADTGTSRKYGGTGLGLSISRDIARLLGGEIRVESQVGVGSTFTLYLPLDYVTVTPRPGPPGGEFARWGPRHPEPERAERDGGGPSRILPLESFDYRDAIEPGERVLLIVEHESRFAAILVDKAHDLGFKAVTTSFGESALELAHEIQPAAITLDLRLPDMDGWVVLDRLKHDPSTRHIPVHVISVDDSWQRGIKLGAFAFLKKPVSRQSLDDAFLGIRGFLDREVRTLLVVEDNDLERANIVAAIGNGDVRTTAVATAAEALEALRAEPFDCLVLDLGLPDLGGLDLLELIKQEINPQGLRVIVYTARDLTPQEQAQLDVLAETTIVKDVRSMEHLVDKTALFLHRVEAKLRPSTRQLLHQGQQVDPDITGMRVLIVDDDIRNLFALTSKLERWEVVVLRAENGKQALDLLTRMPDIDLVLMDIMMPEMDGYETMRAIRERPQFRSLPIIALTAKAMREDRQKCIEAGASDYLAKPVSSEQLLSMLRVWSYRKQDQDNEKTASRSEVVSG